MRTAIVSTYPPRAGGIGTFATDVRATLLGVDCIGRADLVAVVNEPSSPQRRGALATTAQNVRGDYVRTARILGRLDVDVVLPQHEYGIFGGPDGGYVLSFARNLGQPLVVTLRTVLSEPRPHQVEVLTELCDEAELVIVMTETALRAGPAGSPVRLELLASRAARVGGLRAPAGTCLQGQSEAAYSFPLGRNDEARRPCDRGGGSPPPFGRRRSGARPTAAKPAGPASPRRRHPTSSEMEQPSACRAPSGAVAPW